MFYLMILVITGLDQLIKSLINAGLFPGQSIPVLGNIFYLTYVRNSGAGFGILAGHQILFIVVTLVIILILLIYRFNKKHIIYLDIALSFIIAGALGNLIDRIRFSYVIDYLDFRIWPVFNLADAVVCIGVGILIIYIWRSEGEKR